MNLQAMIKSDLSITFDSIQKFNKYIDSGVLDKYISVMNINPGKSITYMYNFYGLLNNELSIPKEYWYIHLKLNGYTDPLQYDGGTVIKLISSEVLDLILDK